jgi:hypothetical protein
LHRKNSVVVQTISVAVAIKKFADKSLISRELEAGKKWAEQTVEWSRVFPPRMRTPSPQAGKKPSKDLHLAPSDFVEKSSLIFPDHQGKARCKKSVTRRHGGAEKKERFAACKIEKSR